MNILPMLVRLEEALGRANLAKQMVLLPAPASQSTGSQNINLVVGYNASPQSQTALDLTLWIAHQTRLATPKQVTVQVVYVINLENECAQFAAPSSPLGRNRTATYAHSRQTYGQPVGRQRGGSAIAELPDDPLLVLPTIAIAPQTCQFEQFEQADYILWQARNLAEEWRGSLKTHLRFGSVAQELRSVVQAEAASLLLLGCNSTENPLVQQLGQDFPCPVLGIPPTL